MPDDDDYRHRKPRRRDNEAYDDNDEDYDDRPKRRRRHEEADDEDLGDDAGMRLLLPVGRSGWAIASGYLGLVSVLFIPAPLAVVTGLLALREMRRDPKKHGMGRAVFGLAMGTLFSALMLAFGIFAIVQKK